MTKKEREQLKIMYKAVFVRFIRAFVAGAITSISLLSAADISSWTDLSRATSNLILSAVIGGMNGVLMAVDKLYRFK